MFNKNSIKKSLQLSILCLLVSCPASWAMIQEIDTLVQAQEELHKADDSTLVLFDVDNTLIDYTPAIGRSLFYRLTRPKNLVAEDATFIQQIKADFNAYKKEKGVKNFDAANQADNFAESIWVLKEKVYLIEPNIIIDFIKNLQSRNTKIIALTAEHSALFPACVICDLRICKKLGLILVHHSLKKK